MRFLKLSSLLFALAAAASACGGSSTPATSSTTPKTASHADDPSCPVVVPGTSVTVEDTATGAALVFVTTGDVAEVRRRVASLAQTHNDHHGAMGPLPDGSGGGGHEGHAGHGGHAGHDMGGGGGHAGHHMGGGKHAGHAGGMIGVHSKAAASDVESGAKVTFVVSGGDVAKIQSELRMHAQHLSSGTCAMGKS